LGEAYVWHVPSLAELDGGNVPAETGAHVLPGDWTTKAIPPVRIIQQPDSLVRNAGEAAELRIEVAGQGPWLYQWRHEGEALLDQTNAILRLDQVTPAQAGEYQVEVLSAHRRNISPVVSRPAALHIRQGGLLFGALRCDLYFDIPGLLVSDLTNHFKFPDQPDRTEILSRFEIAPNRGDIYGSRLSGYLIPPVTGEYVFYIASDNASTLFLSSDDDPAHKRAIAHEREWSFRREWRPRMPSKPNGLGKVSDPIPMEAGRYYYVEVLHKESDEGDAVAVAWQPPGQPAPLIVGAPILGRYLACRDVSLPAETQ